MNFAIILLLMKIRQNLDMIAEKTFLPDHT